MKRINRFFTLLILTAIICGACSGCNINIPGAIRSNERNGVPDSVILRSSAYSRFSEAYDNVDYSISHNVDPSSHTDTVSLEMRAETGYSVVTYDVQYLYEYSRSDDLWTFVRANDTGNYHIEIDGNKISNHSPWEGYYDANRYYSYEYTLYIDYIDFDASIIFVSYYIDYVDEDRVDNIQESTIALDLYEYLGTYCFDIPSPTGTDYAHFMIGPNGVTPNY